MLDAQDAAPLPGWLDQLSASGLAPLAGAAKALGEDRHAVIQGITTSCNPGVNEGRITDVKLQKRIMAGRAGVPLVRHRVVLIAHQRRRYVDGLGNRGAGGTVEHWPTTGVPSSAVLRKPARLRTIQQRRRRHGRVIAGPDPDPSAAIACMAHRCLPPE
ncbi:hypothetical protein [Streptomyces sp. NPDC050485]|uniref:hypothetical protein n=1 Tax=Streptomyces sp. NPDC050485 TaxID=3365617 RepID=UPI0037BB3A1F